MDLGDNVIPQAFTFSRYRAFRDQTRVELWPLTLIIGPNGSGKSVITRFPLLLGSGLESRVEAPLDLEAGGVSHAMRFEDLIFQRSSQPFSLGAQIADPTNCEFVTTLRHISEKHVLGVEAFELVRDGKVVIHLIARTPEDIGTGTGTFVVSGSSMPYVAEAKVLFKGLFPVRIEGLADVSKMLADTREKFESCLTGPSYLGPFRSERGSLARIPRQGVNSLGPMGEYALDLLGDNRLRSDGELTQEVEAWFARALAGNRLNLTLVGDLPRLQVHDPLRSVDVEISETGAGFAQVLPIAVQAYAKKLNIIRSPLVVVEQPELHLHPAVHGEVMDLLIDTVLADPSKIRCICETHSEQMITRLRRRIAEGKISNDLVRVLSVGHRSSEGDAPESVRTIAFDEFGTPDSWPIGVFDEAFDDLVHIREAGQRRLTRAQESSGSPE